MYHRLQSAKFPSLRASSTPILLSKQIFVVDDNNYFCRLKEVIYSQEQLYLVFEYLEFDLKKYMRAQGNQPLPREQA